MSDNQRETDKKKEQQSLCENLWYTWYALIYTWYALAITPDTVSIAPALALPSLQPRQLISSMIDPSRNPKGGIVSFEINHLSAISTGLGLVTATIHLSGWGDTWKDFKSQVLASSRSLFRHHQLRLATLPLRVETDWFQRVKIHATKIYCKQPNCTNNDGVSG